MQCEIILCILTKIDNKCRLISVAQTSRDLVQTSRAQKYKR